MIRGFRVLLAAVLGAALLMVGVGAPAGAAPGDPATEGEYVWYDANVYRIAGGAPTYVTLDWWNTLRTPPLRGLTAPEWSTLPRYPRDGSFVRAGGVLYTMAGGAPVHVSSWEVYGGEQPVTDIDPAAVANAGTGGVWDHLRPYPEDGTFLEAHSTGSDDGSVFRVAGGAPIAVTTWAAFGGPKPAVRVDRAAVLHAGGDSPWNHLRARPADMFVAGSPSGRVFRVVEGHPYLVASWAPYGGVQPVVALDDVALDSCDHLDCTPFGALESVTASPGQVQVTGWVMDPEVTTPVDVRIYVDGTYHSQLAADASRPDVDADYHRGDRYGFTATLSVAAGSREVCVLGLDSGPTAHSNVQLGCTTLTVPAPEPPSPPAAPRATAGDRAATVSWSAPAQPGSAAVDGYRVVATPGQATCTTTGETSCVVRGLVNGTSYRFTVAAHSAAGWSDPSAASAAVVPAAKTIPVRPKPPAPRAAVKVRSKSGASKLFVDVDPNVGAGYWTFRVQKLRADGSWQTGKTYRTKGRAETRTLNLKRGTYRVVVNPKYGRVGVTSSAVRLKK